MSNHNSATERDETPHTINSTNNQTISDALKRRAQSVINDKSIDAGTRAWIRYAVEINDPWLPELVRRVDAGETIFDNVPPTSDEKIEALAEIICRAGKQSPAAFLVLMATLENASHPKALANTANRRGSEKINWAIAMFISSMVRQPTTGACGFISMLPQGCCCDAQRQCRRSSASFPSKSTWKIITRPMG